MKQVSSIDKNGLYVEPVIVDDDKQLNEFLIVAPVPDGFYRPKWDFTNKKWVEGLPSQEIQDIENTPVPKTELELLKEELEAAKVESAAMNAAIIDLYEMMLG